MSENRYVILHHKLAGGEHWDLMLEQTSTLATWQLASPPKSDDHTPISAKRIGDHRKAYLEYEGPVSGGRGTVKRVHQGRYETISKREDRWLVLLYGDVLSGYYELNHVQGQPADRWTFQPAANASDGLTAEQAP